MKVLVPPAGIEPAAQGLGIRPYGFPGMLGKPLQWGLSHIPQKLKAIPQV